MKKNGGAKKRGAYYTYLIGKWIIRITVQTYPQEGNLKKLVKLIGVIGAIIAALAALINAVINVLEFIQSY